MVVHQSPIGKGYKQMTLLKIALAIYAALACYGVLRGAYLPPHIALGITTLYGFGFYVVLSKGIDLLLTPSPKKAPTMANRSDEEF